VFDSALSDAPDGVDPTFRDFRMETGARVIRTDNPEIDFQTTEKILVFRD
jgi:hypothetical protein